MPGPLSKNKQEQRLKQFDLRGAMPIDSRCVITDLTTNTLNSELPNEVRYKGLIIYDRTSSRLYGFLNGVDNSSLSLIPVISQIAVGNIVLNGISNKYLLNHQLTSDILSIKTYIDDVEVFTPVELLPVNDVDRLQSVNLDFSVWVSNNSVNATNVKFVIIS